MSGLGDHVEALLWGAVATIFSGSILLVLGSFGYLAYALFPWSLLAVPALTFFYAVGRIAWRFA